MVEVIGGRIVGHRGFRFGGFWIAHWFFTVGSHVFYDWGNNGYWIRNIQMIKRK